jgi:copper chaperone for superoxide dismutase
MVLIAFKFIIEISENMHIIHTFLHPLKLLDRIAVREGQAYFKDIIDQCDLNDCIGRSIAVRDPESNRVFAAGIIARASPISGNEKKICLCSGKTIWQERQDVKNVHEPNQGR